MTEDETFASIEKLVHKCCRKAVSKFPWLSDDYDDIVQDANIIAVRAMRNFKVDRKTKLSTYIASSVKKALLRITVMHGNKTGVHIPGNVLQGISSSDDHALIAKKLKRSVSLNMPSTGHGDVTGRAVDLWATMVDRKCQDPSKREEYLAFETALESLSPRERDCLLLHYLEDKTLHEIGCKYSVGRERIRQICETAIKKLEKKLYAKDRPPQPDLDRSLRTGS